MYCKKCGEKIGKESVFCEKCGFNQNDNPAAENTNMNKKSKKTAIIVIVSIVSVILAIGIGVFVKYIMDQRQKNAEEIEESHKELENSKFFTECGMFSILSNDLGADLEDLGNSVLSHWRDYIYEDKYETVDEAIDKALEDNSELISTIKDEMAKVREYHNKFTNLNVTDPNYKNAKQTAEELYDSLIEFYSIVTNPSGNYNSFYNSFSEIDTKTANLKKKLSTYLYGE